MLRHEFHPGKLVLGLFLLIAAIAYAGDAGGLWDTPWFVAFPLLLAGLLLGGAAAAVAYGIRGRPGHRSMRHSTRHPTDRSADPSTDLPADHIPDRPADRSPDDSTDG
ncbi:hypothetical protein OG453_22095 [Streptomyces sp. NBC_01381]|uniref:hypothetical protein n=1 Tax=Streptomyces sp. NBC_01381 TaxID=2903845 RepID=UPI00225A0943|nr:hypothetical protein [Streptomyces sp. NBC_01381]MCX4669334.1 hypothetical protein [Streptomyces sp. NBC_01381]